MIVYIVEVLTAQSYDNTSWIVKAFDSEEKAHKWVDAKIAEEEDANPNMDCNSYIITEQELE